MVKVLTNHVSGSRPTLVIISASSVPKSGHCIRKIEMGDWLTKPASAIGGIFLVSGRLFID